MFWLHRSVYKTLPVLYLYSATFISVYATYQSTQLRHDKQVAGKAYVALQLRSSNVHLRFSSMHPKHALKEEFWRTDLPGVKHNDMREIYDMIHRHYTQ